MRSQTRKALLFFTLSSLLFATTCFGDFPPLKVGEEDGTPSGVATELKFSNGSVTKSNTVFTINTGSGSGDSITADGTAIDTTAAFQSTDDIDFKVADGGAGGPDIITAGINWDAISDEINYDDINWDSISNYDTGKILTATTSGDVNWDDVSGSGISNIVEDTTPQLGGELDAQGNNIIDLGNVTFQTGASGGTLRTGTSAADKFVLQAYDVNDTTYRTIMQADAGNSPIMQLFTDLLHFENSADATKILDIDLSGATTSTTTTFAIPSTAGRTITFPDATDTLVGKATTDTLTNKTIDTTNTVTINASDITDLNAGTDITADLEEEVTEGSLADSTIVSADIKDGNVNEVDINWDNIDIINKTNINWDTISNFGSGKWLRHIGSTSVNWDDMEAADITDLGSNVGTWLVTPSSANLASALTDESGTGSALFGTSTTNELGYFTSAGSVEGTSGINWDDSLKILYAASTVNINWEDISSLKLPADAIDAITELSSGIKSGTDGTVVTGTSGTSGNCAKWDANGDLVDHGSACGGSGSPGGSNKQLQFNDSSSFGGTLGIDWDSSISVLYGSSVTGVNWEDISSLRLPGKADCTGDTATTQVCVDTDDSTLYVAGSPVGGGSDTNSVKTFVWPASATLPLEAADSISPISKNVGTNVDTLDVSFDDSTDECRTVSFIVPTDVQSGSTITFGVLWYSKTATTGNVVWDFRHTGGDTEGEDWDSALTTESAASDAVQGTTDLFTRTEWTETLSNLGWAADDLVSGVFCRDGDGTAGTDSMTGDAEAFIFYIEVPRA